MALILPRCVGIESTRCSEVGIYKRKQELDQESDQESKKKRKRKHALDQESVQEKKQLSFFLDRQRVFFLFFLLSCFLFLIPTSDGPKNGRTAAADKLIMNCELRFLPTAIIPRLRSAKTEMNILRARVSCTKTWSKMKNRLLMMSVCFPPKKSQYIQSLPRRTGEGEVAKF